MSLSCKLVPVQYQEYENGLLKDSEVLNVPAVLTVSSSISAGLNFV